MLKRPRPSRLLSTAVVVATGLALVVGAAPAANENWPRFLGPTGIPVGTDPNLPTTWSRTENVE